MRCKSIFTENQEFLPVVPLLTPEWPFRSLGVLLASSKYDHFGELTAANTAPFSFRLALNFLISSTVSGKWTFEANRSLSLEQILYRDDYINHFLMLLPNPRVSQRLVDRDPVIGIHP